MRTAEAARALHRRRAATRLLGAATQEQGKLQADTHKPSVQDARTKALSQSLRPRLLITLISLSAFACADSPFIDLWAFR